MSKNVNKIITERIIERIKSTNELPWSRPWASWTYKGKQAPCFNLRGTPYRGMNSLLLSWLPYEYPIFASYKQIKDLGGNVRKGEKSHVAVFFKMIEKADAGKTKKVGSESPVMIPLIRYYNVFNIFQCENLEGKIPLLEKAGGCGWA